MKLVADTGHRLCKDHGATSWHSGQQWHPLYGVCFEGCTFYPALCTASHPSHLPSEYHRFHGQYNSSKHFQSLLHNFFQNFVNSVQDLNMVWGLTGGVKIRG